MAQQLDKRQQTSPMSVVKFKEEPLDEDRIVFPLSPEIKSEPPSAVANSAAAACAKASGSPGRSRGSSPSPPSVSPPSSPCSSPETARNRVGRSKQRGNRPGTNQAEDNDDDSLLPHEGEMALSSRRRGRRPRDIVAAGARRASKDEFDRVVGMPPGGNSRVKKEEVAEVDEDDGDEEGDESRVRRSGRARNQTRRFANFELGTDGKVENDDGDDDGDGASERKYPADSQKKSAKGKGVKKEGSEEEEEEEVEEENKEEEDGEFCESIDAFWGDLATRFETMNIGGKDYPNAAMTQLMSAFQDHVEGTPFHDVFPKVYKALQINNAHDLLRQLVALMLASGVTRRYLLDNGVYADLLPPDDDSEGEDEEDEDEEDEEYEEESEEKGSELDSDDDEYRDGGSDSSMKKKLKPQITKPSASTPKKAAAPKAAKPAGDSDSSKKKKDRNKKRLRRSPDKWTAEEDAKLMELVEKYGVSTKKWRQIADELGTSKNSAKCAQHWRRVLAPGIHKGSWTAEEEMKLLEGVRLHGLTQWTTIAKEIPGRTDIQCRYHYLRQKNSRMAKWNGEEEALLRNLIARHGENWIDVSDSMATAKIRRTPRTALECREHWEKMNGGKSASSSSGGDKKKAAVKKRSSEGK